MKLNKIAIAVAAATMAMSSIAAAELSANIGVTSNYMWRGWTQSGTEAAVSGGLDYAHESGFYAGTWASSLGGGGEEIDFYAGFGGEAGGIGYSIGLTYFGYPSATPDVDFTEVNGSVSYEAFTFGLDYTIDADVAAAEGDLHAYLSAGMDIGDGWSVGGTFGHVDFDAAGVNSYSYAQLDVSKSAGDFGDFTFSVSKATDDVPGGDDELIPFVSWGKSF